MALGTQTSRAPPEPPFPTPATFRAAPPPSRPASARGSVDLGPLPAACTTGATAAAHAATVLQARPPGSPVFARASRVQSAPAAASAGAVAPPALARGESAGGARRAGPADADEPFDAAAAAEALPGLQTGGQTVQPPGAHDRDVSWGKYCVKTGPLSL